MSRLVPRKEFIAEAKTRRLGELSVETDDMVYSFFRGPLRTATEEDGTLVLVPVWIATSGVANGWRIYPREKFVLPLDTPISQVAIKRGDREEWVYTLADRDMRFTISSRLFRFSLQPAAIHGISAEQVRALRAWELDLPEDSDWRRIEKRAEDLKTAGDPDGAAILQQIRRDMEQFP